MAPAFNLKDSPEDLLKLIRTSHLTKIPAFEGQIDNILGLIYAKSAFMEPTLTAADLRKLIRPVQFVPEFLTLEQLMVRFRQTRTQLAIAVDEYGGVVGVVALEDAVEQMVGDIYTVNESTSNAVREIGDDLYSVAGDLSITDWSDVFSTRVDARGVSTVAGLLASHLKRIPKEGDTVQLDRILMTVEKMHNRRVVRVRLQLLNDVPTRQGKT